MIREAKREDVPFIRQLLIQLGYDMPEEIITHKLNQLLASPLDDIYIYETENRKAAFMTLHYSIQLAFAKDFCEIGYFVVDQHARSEGIGKEMEEFACHQARQKGCGSMNVFSMSHRTDAHRFYIRQGYHEIEKFFTKEIE